VAGGILAAGLDVSIANVAATCLLAVLIGLAFGAFALALSASSGRTGVATYGTTGVALVTYVANSFLSVNDRLAGWARLSPFHWYLGGDPLDQGLDVVGVAILVVLVVVFVSVAVVRFERRDLRLGA
jgi:ABC-2 type transport system permease protein